MGLEDMLFRFNLFLYHLSISLLPQKCLLAEYLSFSR